MLEWGSVLSAFVQLLAIVAVPVFYLRLFHKTEAMTPQKGTVAPPSSPAHSRSDSGMDTNHSQPGPQHPPLPQQQIANLLQFAQTTNPTNALSALMDALTLQSGNGAAQNALERIRSELGDTVADSVAGGRRMQQPPTQLSDREMTLKAMQVVQELLHDESTILYSQGRSHILQQAMEDGSSVVCSKCGDMISRDRWSQHAEYWCRAVDEEKECDGESMALDD